MKLAGDAQISGAAACSSFSKRAAVLQDMRRELMLCCAHHMQNLHIAGESAPPLGGGARHGVDQLDGDELDKPADKTHQGHACRLWMCDSAAKCACLLTNQAGLLQELGKLY